MAQNKLFKWYGNEDRPGIAGMKADTTVDVVDSYAAESSVMPGDAVLRGTEEGTVKSVTAATDGPKVIGIALHKHYDPEIGCYPAGTAVDVMTSGDVYVTAGGDVQPGDKADIAIDDGAVVFTKSGGTNTLPGVTFLNSGAKGDVVRIRIRL